MRRRSTVDRSPMSSPVSSAWYALSRARRSGSRRGVWLAALVLLGWLVLLPTSTDSPALSAYLARIIGRSAKPELWLIDQVDGTVRLATPRSSRLHPIRLLMHEAQIKWKAQLARQSPTFAIAVEAYRSRYGRSPPKGFDAWWKFTKAKGVQIVDDYDRIHSSITPFLALDPEMLATRLKHQLEAEPLVYALETSYGSPINTTGERGGHPRAQAMKALHEGFRAWLPPDFGVGPGYLGEEGGDEGLVRLVVSDHDLGPNVMGQDFRVRMMALASEGQTIDEHELRDFENFKREGAMSGVFNACSKQSPAGDLIATHESSRSLSNETSSVSNDGSISFIRHHLRSFDFCLNPKITSLHGIYSDPRPRQPHLIPQLVLSTTVQGTQVLVPQAGHLDTGLDQVPWDEKTTKKIFWRGSTTGDHHHARSFYDWRNSHRVRLHTTANARHSLKDVLVERSDGSLTVEKMDVAELNDHLMDVGISSVTQCTEEDGTCAEMRLEIDIAPRVEPKDALKYKYAYDIDGNAWSSRFRRLLSTGSVVFKTTIFPDWNSEWLTPWLHYIPVQLDFSDLYHSASFFLGTPGDVHPGHDDLGREISEAAVDYVDRFWREEDMQSYWFRLLLEYRRAMAWNRNAMSMGGKMIVQDR